MASMSRVLEQVGSTHPPVRMEQGEREVVDHSVGVVIPVGVDLDAHAETLQAKVKVWAHSALYAYCVANVLLAVVAVIQRPVYSHTCTHSAMGWFFDPLRVGSQHLYGC